MTFQTDGLLVIGELPNEEHYPCLVCREVPDRVYVDLFTPEPSDIPASVASRVGETTLVVTYRLCPRCHKANPGAWKIRLLLLERLKAMTEAQ